MRQEPTEEVNSGWVTQEDLCEDRTLQLGDGRQPQEEHSRQREPSADALRWQSRRVLGTEQREEQLRHGEQEAKK